MRISASYAWPESTMKSRIQVRVNDGITSTGQSGSNNRCGLQTRNAHKSVEQLQNNRTNRRPLINIITTVDITNTLQVDFSSIAVHVRVAPVCPGMPQRQ
ncbi:MAG: hypothetical protein P8X74_13950 [Reinekea sp.]